MMQPDYFVSSRDDSCLTGLRSLVISGFSKMQKHPAADRVLLRIYIIEEENEAK